MNFKTAKMIAQEQAREETLLKERDEVPELTAKDLKQGLSGSLEDRMKEDRTIVLTMKHGEKPNVSFSGFWNGHLVKNAMNAISRCYRLRRHKQVRANATVQTGG